ncbi:MAG: HAD-IA family hydrolase [Fuerstiella sp.]
MSFVSNIQAVVFDAVGTLIYPSPGVSVAYRSYILQHCGFEANPDSVAHAVSTAMTSRSTEDHLTTSEEQEYDFWLQVVRKVCEFSEHPVSEQQISECFNDLFQHFARPENWKLFPEVSETVSFLRGLKLPIALASNFDKRLHSVCDGLEPLSGCPVRVVSSEIGFRKPSSDFYQAVCQQLQLPAEQILMVGDDLTNDIIGATSCGLKAAWVNRRREDSMCLPPNAVEIHHLTDLLALFQATDAV